MLAQVIYEAEVKDKKSGCITLDTTAFSF